MVVARCLTTDEYQAIGVYIDLWERLRRRAVERPSVGPLEILDAQCLGRLPPFLDAVPIHGRRQTRKHTSDTLLCSSDHDNTHSSFFGGESESSTYNVVNHERA